MTALLGWGQGALIGSAILMVAVLIIRSPVRYLFGPRLAYALWAVPALRLVLPSLPAGLFNAVPLATGAATRLPLFVGSSAAVIAGQGSADLSASTAVLALWLAGALACFAVYTARHILFCRTLSANSTSLGQLGGVAVLAADVGGPLAFGVLRRRIAVPRTFARQFNSAERDFALAHERAHHSRGDLLANWLSLAVLAAHWWNPVAWAAIRAFRDDQEFAADAHVLAASRPGALAIYAHVLAKASGIGALPACNLNPRANLKGRLTMLAQAPRSSRRVALGTATLIALGTAALAATASGAAATGGGQVTTIGVKPDGGGSYALLIGKTAVAPGAPLSGGRTLPADFTGSGGCDLKPSAKPMAMVIKGEGGVTTYTVMCGSAAPVPVRATLTEGLTSLRTMRTSIASQPASAAFPETERTHALAAVDRSIHQVQNTLATVR